MGYIYNTTDLAWVLSPRFENLGQAGKAGWTIGRRSIAVAMGKTDKGKGPENPFPVERVAQGGATPDKQA